MFGVVIPDDTETVKRCVAGSYGTAPAATAAPFTVTTVLDGSSSAAPGVYWTWNE